MTWLLNISIVIIAFISMEVVAWLTHKYIMHGLLWNLHRDHHQPHEEKTFEKNDYFFVIFALPAIICFLIGVKDLSFPLWIAIGITLYGIAYFFIHDLFIHQRLKIFRKADSVYFRAIRKAHKIHHKHLGQQHGECFGLLWVPLKYFKDLKKHT